jgi:hypothetical protein
MKLGAAAFNFTASNEYLGENKNKNKNDHVISHLYKRLAFCLRILNEFDPTIGEK